MEKVSPTTYEIFDYAEFLKNIEKFTSFGIQSKTAFETQSLLQLKNEYCNKSKCLECVIGSELMKKC